MKSTVIAALLFAAASVAPLSAQQIHRRVENVNDLSALGEALFLESEGVGQQVTQRLTLAFGSLFDEVSLQNFRVYGSDQFTLEYERSELPLLIRGSLSFDLLVIYNPTGPGPANGTLEVRLRQEDGDPEFLTFNFPLVGRVPAFSLAYELPGSARRPVPQGGLVDFGHRPTNHPSAATLVLSNSGSREGLLRAARVTGTAFSLASPPTLPAKILPGQEFTMELAFNPLNTAAYGGELILEFGLGAQAVTLAGVGGDLLQFQVVRYREDGSSTAPEAIQSGAQVVFGGADASIAIEGRNTRQSTQRVEAARLTGDFQITEGPQFPLRLEPQEAFAIRLAPTGRSAGTLSGELFLGDAVFSLQAEFSDLGAVRFSMASGTVAAGEEVPVGVSLAAPYATDLVGALRLDVASREFSNDPSIQWATGSREVSFRIPAGQTAAVFPDGGTAIELHTGRGESEIAVTAHFTTEASGLDVTPSPEPELNLSVEIDELPAVSFTHAGGTVAAGEEVPVGVSLAAPYATDLAGALRLDVASREFSNDPSIQWATGSREVSFRIPAGQTAAVFPDGGTAIELHTGRGESEIAVTAHFTTEASGLDVTPSPEPELNLSVEIDELPAVSFTHAGGTVAAGEEVPVGVSLAAPYATDLAGALRLDVASREFSNDPSIQWATGSREVSFRIPAGQTAAVFPDGGTAIELHTGRGESEIAVTAHFTTEASDLDVTPSPEPELNLSVEIDELPAVSFTHVGGTVAAADQVALGLDLAEPYGSDLAGVVLLRFETRVFSNDPAIQWSTGGREAIFRIPAGQTAAVFAGGTTNAFQTGTVAGGITASARLFLDTQELEDAFLLGGGIQAAAQIAVDVSPAELPEVRFDVLEAAPVLQRAVLGSTGQGRFSVQVTGYSTVRAVSSLSFEFAGVGSANLTNPSVSVDATESFYTYYGGNQSSSFGSQFTVTVDFTLDSGVYEDIRSVSVTASNSLGESNAVSLTLN